MKLAHRRVLSVAVAVALGMIGAVQLADPVSLGIPIVVVRWLGIVGTGLGILQTFLPQAQGPTKDPYELANRVWSLPVDERERVGEILATRAERSKARRDPDNA